MGIDPGLDGAIATIRDGIVTVWDMPTVEERIGKSIKRRVSGAALAYQLEDLPRMSVWIEAVHAMPGQGVSSMFNFGRGLGIVEGVLQALHFPIYYVTPQGWQGWSRVRGKDGGRARASEIYPKAAGQFARKRDNGRADAVLIAHYGYTRT